MGGGGFPAVLLIIWNGLFEVPLTDLTAVCFSFLSLLLLLKLINNKGDSVIQILFYSVSLGIVLYATYNIRNTYLYLVFIVIMFLFYLRKKIVFRNYMVIIVGGVFGFILCAIPQIYINFLCYGRITIKNPLNLFMTQGYSCTLLWKGLLESHFDAMINPTFPSTSNLSKDTVMNIILSKGSMASINKSSLLAFLQLFFKYPLEYITHYLVSAINYFDIRFSEIYIFDLNGRRYMRLFLDYTVWFLGGANLWSDCKAFRLSSICVKKKRWFLNYVQNRGIYLGIIIIPAILAIPLTVETRYAVSLHVLLICFATYFTDIRCIVTYIKKNVIIIPIFVIFYFIFVYTTNQTWAVSEFGQYFFN